MARATRGDFPRAWYHVLNRGTERRAIFRSKRCCEKLLELLSSLPERFGVRLHGYALMGNHYHLQLESREANLSKRSIGLMSATALRVAEKLVNSGAGLEISLTR
jgi:putative transposase